MAEQDGRGRRKENRDLALMTRIFYIMQEIRSLQRRSEFQNELLFSTTKRLTGMPGGGGLPKGFDAIIGELEEMNREYGEKIAGYVRDLRKAERILNGIQNEKLRVFVRLYYVDQVEKTEILRELNLSEYQFEKIRKGIEEAENMWRAEWPGKNGGK